MSAHIEYVIFDEALRDRLVSFIAGLDLECAVREDPIAGYVVRIADDLPEEVEEAIEDEYEVLMTLQQEMVESAAGSEERTAMAVEVALADGRQISISLPPAFARRLHEHFSIDEIRQLVASIAQEAVDPRTGPLCGRASA